MGMANRIVGSDIVGSKGRLKIFKQLICFGNGMDVLKMNFSVGVSMYSENVTSY